MSADSHDLLRSKLLKSVPSVLETHFRSVAEQSKEYEIFVTTNRFLLEPSIELMLKGIIDALFLDPPSYRRYIETVANEGFQEGLITVNLLGQNVTFMLELSKNLHTTIQNALFAIIEETVASAAARLVMFERVVECSWTRFTGFARSYIAAKDQQIDYLHSQKVSVMGQMAAGMAHEIRNPLASIKGFAQLIQNKLQQPDVNINELVQYLSYSIGEVESINGLVSDFLLLARKNEPVKNEETSVDLKEVVQRVAAIARQNMFDRDITLSVRVPSENLPVRGIMSQLEQVCLNIVKNSIDAVAKGGLIEIAIESDPSTMQVILCFRDNGEGMPKDIADRVFDPFFTTKTTGTGLGLAICKQIVEQHNGKIVIDSEVRQGTNVIIMFPQTTVDQRRLHHAEFP